MQKNEYIIDYFHPNVMRHIHQNGIEEYAIHDVFFNAAGKSITWTIEALSPLMPSVEALKEKLLQLLQLTEPFSPTLESQYKHADLENWLKYIDAEPIIWELFDEEQEAQLFLRSRRIYAEPRVLLHPTSDGGIEFAIHEVYCNKFGEVVDWMDDAMSPRLPSLSALREELQNLIGQAKPPEYTVVCGDEQNSYRLNEIHSWLDATEKEVLS